MRHAVSDELYAYWRALGREGRPPERNDLDPGAMRGLIAGAFLLDFDRARGFPFLICGSKVGALFLTDLRGAPFLNIWRETDRRRVAAILEAAAEGEAAHLLVARARPPGRAPIEIEVTALPLRHEGRPHVRMLGSLSAGAGADWLGLIGTAPMALTAHRTLASNEGAAGTP